MRKVVSPIAAVLLALGFLAAACGTEDEAPDQPQTIDVTAVNYAFEGLPSTIAAGSTLTLYNGATDEAHELVAFRINDDVDLTVEEILEAGEEEMEQYIAPGPPATVIVAGPGSDGTAVVGDGSISDPGRYALACFIPTGADPDEFLAAAQEAGEAGEDEGPPDVEGGPPHFTEGMFAELNVE